MPENGMEPLATIAETIASASIEVITGADSPALTVRAGDSFVIPRGFVGTWEVVDRTTKRFVICEALD